MGPDCRRELPAPAPAPDAHRGELARRSDRAAARLRARIDQELVAQRLEAEREQDRIAVAAIVLIAVATALVLLWATLGVAQRAPSDVELLARITVHETGWEDTGDAEAIHAVLTSGAAREAITWQAYARRYSARLHRGEVRRRWAAELTEDCARPESWPRAVTVTRSDGMLAVRPHPGWRRYVERCEAVMVRVREVLAGERVHHCERVPHDWGGRVDRARARRLGLIEIDCSAGDVETIGDYYLRPSLLGEGS